LKFDNFPNYNPPSQLSSPQFKIFQTAPTPPPAIAAKTTKIKIFSGLDKF